MCFYYVYVDRLKHISSKSRQDLYGSFGIGGRSGYFFVFRRVIWLLISAGPFSGHQALSQHSMRPWLAMVTPFMPSLMFLGLFMAWNSCKFGQLKMMRAPTWRKATRSAACVLSYCGPYNFKFAKLASMPETCPTVGRWTLDVGWYHKPSESKDQRVTLEEQPGP